MTSIILLLSLAAADPEPAEAHEQPKEVARALPAVAGDTFTKAGRFEVAPIAAFSFRDSFYRKYVVGAEVAWHLHDAFALAGWAGYSFTQETGALHVCDAAGCAPPNLEGKAPGDLAFVTGLDAQWSPFYGKVSFLAETFGNFDVHLRAGPALVGYKNPGLALGVGGRAGLGARYFVTRWLALRADVDDLVYPEQVSKLGITSTEVRNQLFFSVGIALFLGSAS